MNYQETVAWMFTQLPVYQLQGASAYKKDLSNTILLCDYLGNPEKNIKFIHVAGTNGKGSTSHMLASIFQEAGYKTGLFTSPHLKDYRERIKINGTEIPEEYIRAFFEKHKPFFVANELSFFEMTVGLAFDYFNTEKVDVAVIETGLGGRLDSTNIITPLISVITNIGMDHVQILGNTLAAIAGEKAGIIKRNIPVIIGEYTSETKPVFLAKANEEQTEIQFASDVIDDNYYSDLKGDYQQKNKKTVLQTLRILLQRHDELHVSEENIKDGLLHVVKNTGLQGRWQQLNDFPKVICDTAHNKDGLELVLKQIAAADFEKLHMVIGVVNDKDLNEILPLLPIDATYYFCRPNIPRGLDASILQQKAMEFDLIGDLFDTVANAYANARQNASKSDFIFIGGSTFVVAEIL